MSSRVLLIGLDGADWEVMGPLLDAGKLPALQRLIEGGVMAKVASLNPMVSPLLWNSIATGKRAGKHGICGFTEVDPQSLKVRPVTSTSRQCKAIWNILDQEGRHPSTINWFASHPAEPLSGVCVSNLFGENAPQGLETDWPLAPETVSPDDTGAILAEARVHPEEIEWETVQLLVPALSKARDEDAELLSHLINEVAKAFSLNSAALWVMENQPWDFLAVYFRLVDLLGHLFMPLAPPRMKGIDERRFELFSDVVENSYRLFDLLLTNMLRSAGDDATVILLSDHGFLCGDQRPRPTEEPFSNAEAWHRRHGVLVMHGPGLKQDELIHGAGLLDVTPTILTLYGLPVGEDMDGRVLVEAFDDPPNIKTVSSWETQDERPVAPQPAMSDSDAEALVQQFVALGYIDPPSADATKAAEQTRWQNRWNLARDYLDASDFSTALPLLEELQASAEDRDDVTLHLAFCQWRLGLNEEAELTLIHLVRRSSEGPDLWYLQGVLALERGEYTTAVELLEQADASQKQSPIRGLGWALGRAHLRLHRWSQAEDVFRRTINDEPDNGFAYQGLACALLSQKRFEEAAGAALDAVSIHHNLPWAHLFLGQALMNMEKWQEAEQACRTAMVYRADFPETCRCLATICRQTDRDEEADRFLQLAEFFEDEPRKKERIAEECSQAQQRATERLDRIWDQPSTTAATPSISPQPADIAATQKTHSDHRQIEAAEVIVVSGLPRSGTSLMMQMLKAGGWSLLTDDYRQPDRFNSEGYFEWEPAKQLAEKPAILGHADQKVVKLVSPLLPFIPTMKSCHVIFMDRPVEEVAQSQNTMLQGQNSNANGDSAAQLQMPRLLNLHRSQALQALREAESKDDTKTQVPSGNASSGRFDFLQVPFVELIAQPKQWAERVANFLGNQSADLAAMVSVVRPELYRERVSASVDATSHPAEETHGELAFNGQKVRQQIFDKLIETCATEAIIETGAYQADTTRFFAERTRLPVFACEINSQFFQIAQRRTESLQNVTIVQSDSRRFLQELAGKDVSNSRCFFYLDAHWYDDLPLCKEVDAIARHWSDPLIMIDDFQVPGDEGYGFDDYGNGKSLTMDLVQDLIEKHALTAYAPSCPSDEETGARRGCLVLAGRELGDKLAGIQELRRVR